eukprot:scaffold24240_cov129-Isochrysis_galbana.AAC.3
MCNASTLLFTVVPIYSNRSAAPMSNCSELPENFLCLVSCVCYVLASFSGNIRGCSPSRAARPFAIEGPL